MTPQPPSARAVRVVHAAAGTPLHPTLIAIGFVLNIGIATDLNVALLPRPLIVALGIGVLATAAGVFLLRDLNRGGLMGGFAVIAIIGGDDSRVVWLAIGGAIAVAILGRGTRDQSRPISWRRATALFNLISALTLVVLAGRATVSAWSATSGATAHSVPAPVEGAHPDVIVILLDAHGRADVLAEDYNEDITPFETALTERGFAVSSASRSNYMMTEFTLASMFNLAHLADLDLPPLTDPAHDVVLKDLIRNNLAFRYLKAYGYQTVAVTPGWDGLALRSADRVLDGGQLTDFESVLIANSIILKALDVVAPDAIASQVRDRVRWNLSPSNWLSALSDGPDFVFVHVPAPHPPYVFDRAGGPVPGRIINTGAAPTLEFTAHGQELLANAYSAQMAYVDQLTTVAIDEVLDSVSPEAIVIVMSDHGPDAHVDWNHLLATDTHERFATFFAARTPGHPKLFGDAPTPVNLFPVLFNSYLGADLPFAAGDSYIGFPLHQDLVLIGDPDAAD